jgi:hypothetical protein
MLSFVRTWIYKLPLPQPVQEAILEALRLALVAFVSTLVTVLLGKVNNFPFPEVWAFVLTVILRGLDKYKYVGAKETLKRGQYNGGLVGF